MSSSEAVTTNATADRWEPVRDLPPSAKLVAKVLDYEGTLSQGELSEQTMLPSRTVRYAISRLEDADVVDSQFSFVDARRRRYTLTI
jgi:DNA-binding MarR family transcriptional regulator